MKPAPLQLCWQVTARDSSNAVGVSLRNSTHQMGELFDKIGRLYKLGIHQSFRGGTPPCEALRQSASIGQQTGRWLRTSYRSMLRHWIPKIRQ